MDYIIPQSKLSKSIYNYIDELFASKDGKTKIFKLDSIDDEGRSLIDAYDFVNNDYYDEGSEYLFSWTGEEYYKTLYSQGDITKSESERLSSESPNVEIIDTDKLNSLNGLFGDLWRPIFMKWFKNKTNLPVKTLYPR